MPVQEYLIDVDAERGVILKLTARTARGHVQTIEIKEIAFDEELDAELFVLDGELEPPVADDNEAPRGYAAPFAASHNRRWPS